MNSDIVERSQKAAAGALCALFLFPGAALATRQATTPRLPASRVAPAPRLPQENFAAAAFPVRIPEATLKAMRRERAPAVASPAHTAAAAGVGARLAEAREALAAVPANMQEAAAGVAHGAGQKLEQAMTGERSCEVEAAAEPTLAEASAWGRAVVERVKGEFAKDIVGYERPIESLLIALIAGKNINFVALPGTAKTKMVRILAAVTGADYKRIQFTPDLMPSDVTGGMVYQLGSDGRQELVFQKGPVFTQILHADEINRAQPKSQSALLEAMQEKAVTAGGVRYELDPNFFVAATMNPIEQDGTYRLPEAQLDRFLGQEIIGTGSEDETLEIIKRNEAGDRVSAEQVTDMSQIMGLRELSRALPMEEKVRLYATRLARAAHDDLTYARRVKPVVGPARAAIDMVVAARALAVIRGKPFVSAQEIYDVAPMVLRHRIAMLDPEDDKEAFIAEILGAVAIPSDAETAAVVSGQARLAKPAAPRRPLRDVPRVVNAPRPALPVEKSWWKPWTWFK